MSFQNFLAKRLLSFEKILDSYEYLEDKRLVRFYLGEKPSSSNMMHYFELFPRQDECYRYILVTCPESSIETVIYGHDEKIIPDSFVPHSDHYDLYDYLESLK